MAGAIIWNGNTITFPNAPDIWTLNKYVKDKSNHSSDGHQVKHHRYFLWRVHFGIKGVMTPQMEADLHTWWDYAMRGNTYALAFDSGKVLNTTCDADSLSGQAILNVLATTGAAAGDLMTITKADRTVEEVGMVSSTGSGTITLTGNLKNDFESGDTVRHYRYFPSVRSMDSGMPFDMQNEGGSNFLELGHTAEEALS